jgi:hypothetical protein
MQVPTISVGVEYFHCRMLKSVLPSGKGLTTEPETGLTILETHWGPPESAITPSEIVFRNPVQAEVRITTKEQKGLMGTIGFVAALGRIEIAVRRFAHLARITAHLARNTVPRDLPTVPRAHHPAHRGLRTAHRGLRIARLAHHTVHLAHHTARLAHHPAHPAQHILRRALHPVLRPAPLQVRADPLRVLLRVPVVPVHFHQGVKATISYEIEFCATDLLGWVNIFVCHRS